MIPISTDAPIYHLPIATVSTIVINVICFLAFCLNAESSQVHLVAPDGNAFYSEEALDAELSKFKTQEEADRFVDSLRIQVSGGWQHALSVEFGTIKPWQWATNNFMHAGWVHLISNMIFLWAFGLIVEGKVGPFLFSLLYLGIGTLYGFVLQFSSLVIGWEGSALGASAAIFGLLALCIAWAPANEFTILMRFGTFEISILMYGLLFIAKELLFWWIHGFAMSSELLHILGFLVALPIGLWMVTSGAVDCEGWDIFSYFSGKTGNESTVGKEQMNIKKKKAAAKEKAKNAESQAVLSSNREEVIRHMHSQVEHAIDQGDVAIAIKLQDRLTASYPTVTWKQKDLYRVIQSLLKSKDYGVALPLIERHIEMFHEHQFSMQTMLIKIFLHDQRPRKALRYLQGMNVSLMSSEQKQQLGQFAATAKKQIAAGVLEVE